MRVIVYVEGGVVQGIRASGPIQVDVLDMDDKTRVDSLKDSQRLETLEVEYHSLPFAAY